MDLSEYITFFSAVLKKDVSTFLTCRKIELIRLGAQGVLNAISSEDIDHLFLAYLIRVHHDSLVSDDRLVVKATAVCLVFDLLIEDLLENIDSTTDLKFACKNLLKEFKHEFENPDEMMMLIEEGLYRQKLNKHIHDTIVFAFTSNQNNAYTYILNFKEVLIEIIVNEEDPVLSRKILTSFSRFASSRFPSFNQEELQFLIEHVSQDEPLENYARRILEYLHTPIPDDLVGRDILVFYLQEILKDMLNVFS